MTVANEIKIKVNVILTGKFFWLTALVNDIIPSYSYNCEHHKTSLTLKFQADFDIS